MASTSGRGFILIHSLHERVAALQHLALGMLHLSAAGLVVHDLGYQVSDAGVTATSQGVARRVNVAVQHLTMSQHLVSAQ